MNFAHELIEILVAFGGGKGGEPGDVAVRFLLPTFFWAMLALVAFRECWRTRSRQDLAIGFAALAGMARELLMFSAEYGGLRGWFEFDALYRIYPPLEHGATMLSGVLIAAAFINYRLSRRQFAVAYLSVSLAAIALLYMATALTWPVFLDAHPRISFGLFWGDMAFRVAASLLMAVAIAILIRSRRQGIRTSDAALIGFLFLFLDEFLMIVNLLMNERHVGTFAPIRHNLHIWAIPCFLGAYWSDLKQSLRSALTAATEEKEKTRAILAGIGDGISIQDTNYKVLFQNEVHKEFIGDHVGELCYQGYEKRDTTCEGCPLSSSFRDGQVHRAERALPFPDGMHYFDITTSPIRDADGAIVAGVEAVREVTEQRRSRDMIEAERERLAVTLRSIGDAVIVTDVAGTVSMINKVAEHLTGWTNQEAAGRPLTEVFHIISEKTREVCANPVEKVITTGVICGLANHTALVRRDGTELIIEDSAAPIRDRESKTIGVVLVFRDTTAKHRMEEELGKMEKLQSVGLLAGGIAHDFNNLLTAIIGNISVAKMHMDKSGKAYLRLLEAEAASKRATDLTYQLLTFSKGGAPVRRATSVVNIIRECATFTLSGTNVAIQYVVADDIWTVDIDPGQISQVFNNLIINAVHAMPEGGLVTCSIDNVVLGENESPMLRAGTYVKIVLQDTGAGIPPEHLARVFEPYFTTKHTGSGLGLASSFSIVRRHDGYITAESKTGQGAAFHIHLPASRTKADVESPDPADLTPGRGRILVMDDERMVLDVAGEMLKDLGYEAAFAKDGQDAIAQYELAQRKGQRFAAVIMDLTIPGGMGGKEAAAKLRELDPVATMLVSSGYSNDPVMADYKKHGFAGVIVKPYTIDGLNRALREAMPRQGEAG